MSSDGPRSRRLGKHGGWLLLVSANVLLLLWGFGAMVRGLRDGATFAFDLPILRAVHSIAGPGLDRTFVAITALGYGWGVIPADALLLLGLALARRSRELAFAGVSIAGSLILDRAIKHSMARPRPLPWDGPLHETGYSFPSAHAMASITLAWVIVLLCWSARSPSVRRMRGWVAGAAAACVALVGVSRIYLGVHYPSDVLGGWIAASAWVISVYALLSCRARTWCP